MSIRPVSSSIYNTTNFNNKRNQKPSFGATVKLSTSVCDSISGRLVYLNEQPLKRIVELIVPELKKLDDNLRITVSGASKPPEAWDLFKKKQKGLKFDITYFDKKKFYNDIMQDPKQEVLLSENIRKALKDKDRNVLYMLGETFGVGKLYYPERGETPEGYVKNTIKLIKQFLPIMPSRLLETGGVVKNPNTGKFQFMSVGLANKKPWNIYHGIEIMPAPINVA